LQGISGAACRGLDEEGNGAFCRPAVMVEHGPGRAHHFLAGGSVAQEIRHCFREGVFVSRLECASGGDERLGEAGEVLHLRAKDDRTPGDDRFDRVLSTSRSQAFAHKDDGRDGVPISQFACGIEEQAIGRMVPFACASSHGREAERAELPGDVPHPFDVARGDDEEEIREFNPKLGEDPTEDFFFAWVRAAREQDRSRGIEAENLQNVTRQLGLGFAVLRIEFDAAREVARLTSASGRRPPFPERRGDRAFGNKAARASENAENDVLNAAKGGR
jgi:hypothetical protein